tara:strand:+ start:3750 stop:4760 length:1011 start_codon:yes stop_codon:yes gene_type:complete
MIITKTPLRITFTGGGSDIPSYFMLHGGHCINAAIDKYVYVLVKKRSDNKIYLKYSENEVVDVDSIHAINHDFIRETLIYLGIDYGLEIINWADIPTKGSGLGSSGSFLVGLLNAIHTLEGNLVTKRELADQASHIEMTLCHKPIGYQDQYAAAFGGLNELIFSDKEQILVNRLVNNDNDLRSISEDLHLFYTGITRESAPILQDQTENLSDNMNAIECMKKNVDLSYWLRDHIDHQRFNYIGEALKRNWELKLNFSNKIANDSIIQIYKSAIAEGAGGGKLIGAGGGGFMMFYIDKLKRQSVEEVLSDLGDYKLMPFEIDKYGSRVIINVETLSW